MTLSHDVAGAGPTVVLLHSTVCDRRMWDPQVPALVDAGYRVLRCDLPGFGETPAPDRPQNDAQEVIDLLDLLGIEQTAVIGASGGGRTALEIAARWPQRVTALELLSTAAPGHEPTAELQAIWEREFSLVVEKGDIAAATEFMVDTWLGPEAGEATREQVRQMQRHAFEVQLAAEEVEPIAAEYEVAAVTAPTLLITGSHDLADFRQIAAELSEQLVNVRQLELSWAGHLPSLERPDAVNPILIDFLDETLRG